MLDCVDVIMSITVPLALPLFIHLVSATTSLSWGTALASCKK